MEHTAPAKHSKTTPRDFFLWAGAVIALYGTVISLVTLLFEYVNMTFPDSQAYYGDVYGGAVRAAMAGVIVLVPTLLILLRIIRKIIAEEKGKAEIWVRRWALVLTIFIAIVVVLIDLITLVTTFLGGELSVRFGLKTLVVLLIASGVFMHFLADLKGYWIANRTKANLVGIAVGVLSLVAVVSGFFIIGTPGEIRMLRYDEQKVSDLQSIQYQLVNYYQQKGELPTQLSDLDDPISSFMTPSDPQTEQEYWYVVTGPLAFELCASFNEPTRDMTGKGGYPAREMSYPSMGLNENWQHEAGETCFARTIDPERYPLFEKPASR
jgi:uncharacterized membrane protein